MIIKRLRRFNISKDLGILRAFVDCIRVFENDILVSVAYRKGRVFCRYDSNFKLKYRVEEKSLIDKGFGDFRGMSIDKNGNMILAGLLRPDTATLFTLNGDGKILRTGLIQGFPLLESAIPDSFGNLYLHSPIKSAPVYKYSPEMEQISTIGEFPSGKAGVIHRIAQIAIDKSDRLILVFENSPAMLYCYSTNGEEIYHKELDEKTSSIDTIAQILDFGVSPENGNIYLLKQNNGGAKEVEIMDNTGVTAGKFHLPPEMRRIYVDKGGIFYTSGTYFGLSCMVLSGAIYGAMTVIDKYRIVENQ